MGKNVLLNDSFDALAISALEIIRSDPEKKYWNRNGKTSFLVQN